MACGVSIDLSLGHAMRRRACEVFAVRDRSVVPHLGLGVD